MLPTPLPLPLSLLLLPRRGWRHACGNSPACIEGAHEHTRARGEQSAAAAAACVAGAQRPPSPGGLRGLSGSTTCTGFSPYNGSNSSTSAHLCFAQPPDTANKDECLSERSGVSSSSFDGDLRVEREEKEDQCWLITRRLRG